MIGISHSLLNTVELKCVLLVYVVLISTTMYCIYAATYLVAVAKFHAMSKIFKQSVKGNIYFQQQRIRGPVYMSGQVCVKHVDNV